ncbi:MAG: DUF368 domain-containing protein [Oscillospiraceae bacterium]|jgi:putative membrane protein|nr:DUF368 domain-containing protein [Oscillospiraceae bacterium]
MTIIFNMIKGFFIGIALVLPGLSGSIFAVVVGLYDKILSSISNFRRETKKSAAFLWPIALGCVAGILASTKAVLWICEKYPVPSYMFFVGLVIGSFPMIYRKIRSIKFKPQYILISVAAFTAMLVLSGLVEGPESSNLSVAIPELTNARDFFTLLLAGLFTTSLMAIPGVSGSVMLMVINQYGTVYNAVGKITDLAGAVFSGSGERAADLGRSVVLLVPFLAGAAIGMVFVAKLLTMLLTRFEGLVYYAVGGIVLATVITLELDGVVPRAMEADFLPQFLIGIVFVFAGYIATIVFDKQEDKLDRAENTK